MGTSPLSETEINAMMNLLPKSTRTDEDDKEFEVVTYEDYVALVSR